ncbi:mitogen-activated protein kinase 15 [Phtheirospermum japonicum]|uniref:Mitogen-activated protein kinase 15 n=1 Tax=Phtheirospermum japonicum TaxID=374723 RepID=A0A830C0Y7_9LAMI|nr:mitogen-activated protein kinase 15 [Phtheirospermum japonicum]
MFQNMPFTDFFTEYGEANLYEIQEVVGKGSYGVVAAAVDTHTGEKVAIKKINNIFEHVSEATRILREIKLLRLLKHPDIVEIKHIMLPPCRREFKDIYVVFELMETDLHHVIKTNDDLTPGHHQFFLYQLLRALKYIHSANVFHRDLKPKNILANADCKVKICDFGLARASFGDAPSAVFWTYTPAIDIWSIGCIFAELITGKPLFPGKNVVHQLELITDLLDPLALRLLERLIAFDPKDRPSAEEALADPYFYGLANVEDEPSTQHISKFEFEFERRTITKDDVRELIYREILEYHPQMLQEYLQGVDQVHFMYPSGVDQFKQQFFRLEGQPGKSDKPPLRRRYASLPRERVCGLIDEGPDEHSDYTSPTEVAIPRPCLVSPKKLVAPKEGSATTNAKASQNGSKKSCCSARCLLRSDSVSASKCLA